MLLQQYLELTLGETTFLPCQPARGAPYKRIPRNLAPFVCKLASDQGHGRAAVRCKYIVIFLAACRKAPKIGPIPRSPLRTRRSGGQVRVGEGPRALVLCLHKRYERQREDKKSLPWNASWRQLVRNNPPRIRSASRSAKLERGCAA